MLKSAKNLFFFIGFMGLLVMLIFLGPTLAQQDESRFIEKKSPPNAPVKILTVKNKGAVLKTDVEFKDDDQWLNGLSLRVVNTSAKPIQFVSIELRFTRPETEGLSASDTLDYGRETALSEAEAAAYNYIMPEKSVELTLSDQQLSDIRLLLRSQKYKERINRLRLMVEEVIFNDDTMWHAGVYFRRDPTEPTRWLPIDQGQLYHHRRTATSSFMPFLINASMFPRSPPFLSVGTLSNITACQGHVTTRTNDPCTLLPGCYLSNDNPETSQPPFNTNFDFTPRKLQEERWHFM